MTQNLHLIIIFTFFYLKTIILHALLTDTGIQGEGSILECES